MDTTRRAVTASFALLAFSLSSCSGISTLFHGWGRDRARSSNASLSGIALSAGSLAPAFSPDTLSYEANVPPAISAITITGIPEDASASVSAPVTVADLVPGDQRQAVLSVTAQDGTSKTYSVTVVARASPVIEYRVTYDANGASGGSAPESQVKRAGVPLTLASAGGSLAKEEHIFGGWNTAADGSGGSYAEGASYEKDADLALFARWIGRAPEVITERAYATGLTTASVEIQVVSYGYGAGVSEIGVVWNTSGDPVLGTSPSFSSAGTVFKYDLMALMSGTTYYARAYAKNDLGFLSYGKQLTFVTE